MTLFRPTLPWTLIALALLSSAAEAARPDTSPEAATHPSQTARDFDLQGEYVGLISGGYRREPIGLQIVAQGDTFAAVEYHGGLPGAGWNGAPKLHSDGPWRGSVATLDGDARQVLVTDGQVWVRDADGILRALTKKEHRTSPTMGAAPPPGAIVLFDGRSTEELKNARVTEDGLLQEGALTERPFRDFYLHVEFRTPFMPRATGQGRGNSGIYIQERYEVQILDSFGLEGEANECGGLYRTRPPDVNMCLPPLAWQTYDITFRAARFNDQGEKTANARLTVYHNGVAIHNDIEVPDKTGAGRPEGPEPRPIRFQDHRDPVRFRNIWIVEHDETQPGNSPRRTTSPTCLASDGDLSPLLDGIASHDSSPARVLLSARTSRSADLGR